MAPPAFGRPSVDRTYAELQTVRASDASDVLRRHNDAADVPASPSQR
jgi:hypothetical protein